MVPIFKNITEKQDTIRTHKRECSSDERFKIPEFFKYGIRFNTLPDGRDMYRTVIIFNLSRDTTLSAVLDRVRGGTVIEAHLLDTSHITGNNSVMVKFVHEDAASSYEGYVREYPIVFDGLTASIAVLKTHTWPTSTNLRNAIFNHQQTRCLEVHNFPSNVTPKMLQTDLQTCPYMKETWIVFQELSKDGILKLHFSSIERAGHAFGLLSKYDRYKAATIYFIPDPCAQPVETLDEIFHHSATPIAVSTSMAPIVRLPSAHPAEVLKQAFSKSAPTTPSVSEAAPSSEIGSASIDNGARWGDHEA